MTLKTQKIISLIWVVTGFLLCFEALVYILNIDQPYIYIYLAIAIGIYLTLKITFFYDLHFKSTKASLKLLKGHPNWSSWIKAHLSMLWLYTKERLHHFRHWKTVRHWITCMGTPWLLYWATVGVLFLNFNKQSIQQSFILLSTIALSIIFWHLKEIFRNQGENTSEAAHVTFQAIKLYSAFVIFVASMGLVQYFCLSTWSLYFIVFGGTMTLMYQSLFHLQKISYKNVLVIIAIAFVISSFASAVHFYWGLNYATGSVFLMGLYNFFWGIFYYYLRKRLNWQIFIEYLLVTLLICGLAIGVTNFKARILPYC